MGIEIKGGKSISKTYNLLEYLCSSNYWGLFQIWNVCFVNLSHFIFIIFFIEFDIKMQIRVMSQWKDIIVIEYNEQ
jgi:hypothetical protein